MEGQRWPEKASSPIMASVKPFRDLSDDCPKSIASRRKNFQEAFAHREYITTEGMNKILRDVLEQVR